MKLYYKNPGLLQHILPGASNVVNILQVQTNGKCWKFYFLQILALGNGIFKMEQLNAATVLRA